MVSFKPRPIFDGYEIECLLGEGGMGAVYLATDTLLQRKVAIKFIITDKDSTARQRFLIEARAIARLQHPNVVAIYRVGEVDGYPYLVSEFIRGTPLDEIARPVTYAMALNLSTGISRALAAAHQKGVLHRDLKPANAILSDDGVVKLLDFGVAKLVRQGTEAGPSGPPPPDWAAAAALLDEQPPPDIEETAKVAVAGTHRRAWGNNQLTEDDTLLGTPLFMAPELWLGAPASFQSDIYGFGMLIYTLLCEHPPHGGSNLVALRRSIMTQASPPLHEIAPHVDKKFGEIIDRCLIRDPARRFTWINEVRKRLERLAGDVTGEMVTEGNPYRGLDAFDIPHRRLFFGRDSEIRLIRERLAEAPFVLVVGDPGVGKTSLCRAGVLSRIRSFKKDSRTWRSVQLLPGPHPVQALAAVLAPVFDAPKAALVKALTLDPGGVARDLRAIQGDEKGLVVFIDQLEEFVTVSDAEEAEEAIEFLSWLMIPSDCVRLLSAVRGEHLSRLAALSQVGDKISHALFFARPLSAERIEEAIVRPAQMMGVSFESQALVRELVADTEAGCPLPLLQFSLVELWERRDRKTHTIPSAALTQIGGVRGALGRHADAVLDAMQPLQRAAAKEVLLRLVTQERTQVRRTLDALNVDSKVERSAVDALVQGRLLTASDTGEGVTYALAHEAIIDGWPTLCRWLSSDAESRWALDRLSSAAGEWRRAGHRKTDLWRRCQLQEIQWISPSKMGETERLFIEASRAAVRRCLIKRLGVALAVPLLAILALVGLEIRAGAARSQQVEAAVADARRLLTQLEDAKQAQAELREQAFTLFDRAALSNGEATWRRYLEERAALAPLCRSAGRALEAALLLDPGRADVRQMIAGHLYDQAIMAASRGAPEEAEAHIERLALYDPKGALTDAWRASGEVTIRAIPDHAALSLFAFDPAADPPVRQIRVLLDNRTRPPIALPPGTYIGRFEAEGHATVRYPFVVTRGTAIEVSVALPRATAVPSGFIYVPPGRFRFGSDAPEALRRAALHTVPMHDVAIHGYLIAEHETTFSDWLTYLDALPEEAREGRAPRAGNGVGPGSLALTRDDAGLWRLSSQPTVMRLEASAGALLRVEGRGRQREQDWRRLPVAGISAEDAERYARWLRDSGRVPGARLCTEREWERAARGSDGRPYPHGTTLATDDANIAGAHGPALEAAAPDEVGVHPGSDSPFGLSDMAGNVWEWTCSAFEEGAYVIRGGSYLTDRTAARVDSRRTMAPDHRDATIGVRICADLPQP